jgi:MFS family permease
MDGSRSAGVTRWTRPDRQSRQSGLPLGDHWLLTMAALSVAVVAFSLSTTLLLPVLPALESRFATTRSAGSWVITVYMLVAAVANPIVGRVGDLFGRRRTLLGALCILLLGAIAATFASTVEGLIAARAVQGVGGAVLPLSFGIVRDRLPPSRRPVAIATLASMTAVGGGVGMPVGGLLVEVGSVDLVLRLVATLALLAFATAFVFVPESTRRATGRLDVIGAALLACAVTGPLLAFSTGTATGWTSPWPPALLITGVVAALIWWRHERRRPDPLVDVRVLRRRPVLLTNVVTFLLGLGLFGAFSLIPIIVQTSPEGGGLGLPPGAAGLLMLPTAVVTFVCAPLVGVVIRRSGAKIPLVASCLAVAAGLVGLGVVHDRVAALVAGAAVMGIGFGALSASAPNLIVAAVHQLETGAQTGVNTMVQNLGTSSGSQLSVVVLASAAGIGPAASSTAGATAALVVCAAAAVVAGVVAAFIPTSVALDTASIKDT